MQTTLGDVTFEHAGSGGLGRMLKKAVSGEGIDLMKVTGHGEVFLADRAQDVHLIYLENDAITGRSSGETFQMSFSGQGSVLVQPSEGQLYLQQGDKSGGLGGLLNS